MGASNTQKGSPSANVVPMPQEAIPMLQRRTFLLSALVAGLIVAIGIPIYFFTVEDYCNTGDALIDQACLKERRRLEELRLGKGKKFNVRPKKEPFKVVEGRIAGGFSQPAPENQK